MNTPAITVLIITYNRAALLKETLDGVLAQTCTDWECVVVDDDSTDETRAVVGEYAARDSRVRYVLHPKQGESRDEKVIAVRRFATAQVSGELIAFLDDDDVWLPDYLETVSRPLRERPSCVLSAGTRLFWDGKQTLETQRFTTEQMDFPLRAVIRHCILVPPQCIVRRSAFNQTPGFRLPGSEDYDLWLQLMPLGTTALLNCPLVKYRVHEGSSLLDTSGEKRRRLAQRHMEVLRCFLQRRDISLYDRLLAMGNIQRKHEQLLEFDLEEGKAPASRLKRWLKLLSIVPTPLLRNPSLSRRYLTAPKY